MKSTQPVRRSFRSVARKTMSHSMELLSKLRPLSFLQILILIQRHCLTICSTFKSRVHRTTKQIYLKHLQLQQQARSQCSNSSSNNNKDSIRLEMELNRPASFQPKARPSVHCRSTFSSQLRPSTFCHQGTEASHPASLASWKKADPAGSKRIWRNPLMTELNNNNNLPAPSNPASLTPPRNPLIRL